MKANKLSSITLFFLLAVICIAGAQTHSQNAGNANSTRSERRFRTISLIRIIANPGDYDGEYIRVAGYLAGAELDGGPGIFVSDSDGRNGILSNAVNLTVRDSTIRGMYGQYVIVSGLYHAPAPKGDFNGYIDNIIEVKPLAAGNTSN